MKCSFNRFFINFGFSFVFIFSWNKNCLAQDQDYFETYTSSYIHWLRAENNLIDTYSITIRSLGHFSLLPQIAIHNILTKQPSLWRLYSAHRYNFKGLREPPIISKARTTKSGNEEDLYIDGHLFLYRDDLQTGSHIIVTFGADWDKEKLIGTVSISYSKNDYFAALEFASLINEYEEEKNPYKGAILHIGTHTSYQFQFFENTQVANLTWDDLILNSETKALAYHLTQNFLENQKEYRRLKISTKQGVLITGPPGTGKSFLAQIIMNSILIGNLKDNATLVIVTARHLTNKSGLHILFQAIKSLGTVCVFMEDIDLFGIKNRNDMNPSEKIDAEINLNELLNGIDGISENNNTLVIGTTNQVENVDDALLRSERLGYHLYFPLPSFGERIEFFNRFGKRKALWEAGLTSEWLATQTEGFSGADIIEVISLSKRFALSENSWSGDSLLLTKNHFNKAIDLIRLESQSLSQKNNSFKKTNFKRSFQTNDKSHHYEHVLKNLLRFDLNTTKL